VQVVTLIAAGCMSALLFALGVYTPSKLELNDLVALRSVALSTTNSTLQGLNTFAAAQTPKDAALAAQVAAQNTTFVGLGNANTKWISNQGIISSFQNATALQAAQLKP
jgi:hypothetical protein